MPEGLKNKVYGISDEAPVLFKMESSNVFHITSSEAASPKISGGGWGVGSEREEPQRDEKAAQHLCTEKGTARGLQRFLIFKNDSWAGGSRRCGAPPRGPDEAGHAAAPWPDVHDEPRELGCGLPDVLED